MIEQKVLQSNIFAFYFTSSKEDNNKHYSEMTMGYYDKTKFTGELEWAPVVYKYMYGVKLDDIKINGKAMNICEGRKEGCLITFDSGTSLLSFPNFAV